MNIWIAGAIVWFAVACMGLWTFILDQPLAI